MVFRPPKVVGLVSERARSGLGYALDVPRRAAYAEEAAATPALSAPTTRDNGVVRQIGCNGQPNEPECEVLGNRERVLAFRTLEPRLAVQTSAVPQAVVNADPRKLGSDPDGLGQIPTPKKDLNLRPLGYEDGSWRLG